MQLEKVAESLRAAESCLALRYHIFIGILEPGE